MISDFLKSGGVGTIELNAQQTLRKQINEHWDKIGFLVGLDGHIKENIATLYENTAKLILSEATDASNSGSFETVVFPIIRRVFSKLLANDIVSVQAMNLSIGKLFFIIPVTSEREWSSETVADGVTGSHSGMMGYHRDDRNGRSSTGEDRFFLPDEVVNSGAKLTQYMKTSLYDLFYNDFMFDNSKGKITIKVTDGVKAVVLNEARQMVAVADNKMKNYPKSAMDGSVANVILEVSGFSTFNAGRLTGPDGNEMDTEEFLASMKVVTKKAIGTENGDLSYFTSGETVGFRVVTQKYGKGIVERNSALDANGKLYIELDLTKPVQKQGTSLLGYTGVDASSFEESTASDCFSVAWAQYDSLELETEIGEVSFKLDSVTVAVDERKLRASWSPEMAQDVAAFHNIDAEAELTAILSEQIAAEIDREILRDLRKAAPWQARFDVNGWRRMSGFATAYTQKDWNQELMTKINQISAQIQKSTLRGGANFVVVSSEVSALLNNLEYFHVSDASAEQDQYNMGIERIGALQTRYQVYVDPYSPAESIIIGHKGKSLLDTGYIYAPYIPMALTPTMYNPYNAAPIKYIMTRYAKKLVNNRFYGHIRVDGLTKWDVKELR